MFTTEKVESASLARICMGTLALTVWLILNVGASGSTLHEVCEQIVNENINFGPSGLRPNQAYRYAKAEQGVRAKLGRHQGQLMNKPGLRCQGRCEA
jgi:hypothetical protein